MRRKRKSRLSDLSRQRHAISLLEVIVSIAILGTAMVAITQLLNIGYRSALSSRLRTDAAIHCDTKMAEIAAGILDLASVSSTPIPDDSNWLYSVDVQPSNQIGLLVVTVTVTQATVSQAPVTMSIVRFMPDPDYDPSENTDTAED